jgi:hypothetical protein
MGSRQTNRKVGAWKRASRQSYRLQYQVCPGDEVPLSGAGMLRTDAERSSESAEWRTDPALSRKLKPPPLGGGGFTAFHVLIETGSALFLFD